ncbi:MAG: DUF6525 family protein [Pseudomonadota bacterium]
MSGNLGETRLKRKRRPGNPMQTYDALPQPLRLWLSQAVLPWSPSSAQRIWARACADGLDVPQALDILARAEERMFTREEKLQAQSCCDVS